MFIVTFEGVKMKILFMTLFLVSFYAHAEQQYVFCANQKGTSWEWLPNDRVVKGAWKYAYVKNNHYFVTLRIKERVYKELQEECSNYFPELTYPQPAKNRFSDWRLFSYFGHDKKLHIPKSKYQLLIAPDCNCLFL